jgi:hypothetical protein
VTEGATPTEAPRETLGQRWRRYWFDPEPPDNLGVCRVLFYALLLAYYGPITYAGWADVPASWRDPIWLFERFHLPILSDPALRVVAGVWKASLVLSCVGLFTRVSSAVALVLGAYLMGLPYNFGKTDHTTALLVFLLGILALSWSGHAWSIDAIIRRRRTGGPPAPSGEYRWPVRAAWLTMAVVFFAAGMAKLIQGGIGWVFSEHFEISLVQRFYDVEPPSVTWGLTIAQHPWLARTFAAGSILAELSLPLALVSRRLRRVLPWTLLAMQIGIGLLMNVWFTRFFFAYVFWVPWDWIAFKGKGKD